LVQERLTYAVKYHAPEDWNLVDQGPELAQ
jgi:hypothetical protein